MDTAVELHKSLPTAWLEEWSRATRVEKHLSPETVHSLAENLEIAAVAVSGGQPIGYAGLIAARTQQGHGLEFEGQPVYELGGAYIRPEYRGRGIWKPLALARIEYARRQGFRVVCITGNPVVQSGLRGIGATPMLMEVYPGLLHDLCLGCDNPSTCEFCPLQPNTSWHVV